MLNKIERNDIIYYLGLLVAISLLFYIVIKSMTLQMNIIEGAVGGRNTTSDVNNDKLNTSSSSKKGSTWGDWLSKGNGSTSLTTSGKSSIGTDKINIPSAVKSNTNTIEDNLLISKYRNTYEQTIIDLESNVSFALLSSVINNAEIISKNPTSSESQMIITHINNLKTFRSTLNDAMKFLDSN